MGEAVAPEVHERLEVAPVGRFGRGEAGGATGGGVGFENDAVEVEPSEQFAEEEADGATIEAERRICFLRHAMSIASVLPPNAYPAFVILTRSQSAESPSGRRTGQERSLPSTVKTMVASPGGWSMGWSSNRKSGPICAMGSDEPLTSKRISTRVEQPL